MEYVFPYPGVYLDEHIDLQREGIHGLHEHYPAYRTPEKLVKNAAHIARQKVKEFFEYREKWHNMMCTLENNMTLQKEAAQLQVR